MPFLPARLWGSSLSRAEEGLRGACARPETGPHRRLRPHLSLDTSAKQLKQKVFELSITPRRPTANNFPIPLAWLRAAGASRASCVADDSRKVLTNWL